MTRTQYLLTCLAEECAEVAQRASKAARFGIDEVQPGQDLDNGERLEQEFNDLVAVARLLGLSVDEVQVKQKYARVDKYMQLSAERGMVDRNGD